MDSDCTGGRTAMQFNTASQNKYKYKFVDCRVIQDNNN